MRLCVTMSGLMRSRLHDLAPRTLLSSSETTPECRGESCQARSCSPKRTNPEPPPPPFPSWIGAPHSTTITLTTRSRTEDRIFHHSPIQVPPRRTTTNHGNWRSPFTRCIWGRSIARRASTGAPRKSRETSWRSSVGFLGWIFFYGKEDVDSLSEHHSCVKCSYIVSLRNDDRARSKRPEESFL